MIKTWTLPARLLAIAAMVAGQGLCVGFGPPRLAARDVDHEALWPQQVQQLCSMTPPVLEPAAALLLDVATGTVVYSRNADAQLAPASTTKMTVSSPPAWRRRNMEGERSSVVTERPMPPTNRSTISAGRARARSCAERSKRLNMLRRNWSTATKMPRVVPRRSGRPACR